MKKFMLGFIMVLLWPIISFALILNVQQAPIVPLLAFLGAKAHLNMVIDPQIQQKTTLHLSSTSYGQMLKTLLENSTLYYQKSHGTYAISKNPLVRKDHSKKIIIHYGLKNQNGQYLISLLKKDPQLPKETQKSLLFDKDQNQIILEMHQDQKDQIQALLAQLDQTPKAIKIKARIEAIDSRGLEALGISLGQNQSSHSDRGGLQQAKINLPIGHAAGSLGFNLGILASGQLLNLNLQALEQKGDAHLISDPSVVVDNGETATIEQGNEVPFETTNQSGNSNVQFKKAVLGLQVTPTLTDQGQLLMHIKVNKDYLTEQASPAGSIPIIGTAHLETAVHMKSNQTLVLGGINNEQNKQTSKRIPFLHHLPLIGWLFENRLEKEHHQELLIFLTASVENSTKTVKK